MTIKGFCNSASFSKSSLIVQGRLMLPNIESKQNWNKIWRCVLFYFCGGGRGRKCNFLGDRSVSRIRVKKRAHRELVMCFIAFFTLAIDILMFRALSVEFSLFLTNDVIPNTINLHFLNTEPFRIFKQKINIPIDLFLFK